MTQPTIRVLLIDDHDLVRHGLRRMLELEDDLVVVGEASDVQDGINQVDALSPDIILMDIQMPVFNGLQATQWLRKKGLSRKVIILSLYEEYLPEAIAAGAGGYLVKGVKREELIGAIRRVNNGEMVLASALMDTPNLVEAALQRFQESVNQPQGNEAQQTLLPNVLPGNSGEQKVEMEVSQANAHLPAVSSIETMPPTRDAHYPSALIETQSMPMGVGAETNKDAAPPGDSEDAYDHAERIEYTKEVLPPVPQIVGQYNQEVELLIPPPVNAHQLMQLSRKLREQYHVEVLETVGSFDSGTWMKLQLRRPFPIRDVLEDMPEVLQVWEAQSEDVGRFLGAKSTSSETTSPGMCLVLKIAGGPTQLSLTI